MWLASAPVWHGIARADVFVTDEGLAFAELNCDTPTGEAEAVVLNALTVSEHEAEGAIDLNRPLEARFVAMVEALAARDLGAAPPRRVGIVYPTEMTDDLALVRLYRQWFEGRGYEVVLGSPYNLSQVRRGCGSSTSPSPSCSATTRRTGGASASPHGTTLSSRMSSRWRGRSARRSSARSRVSAAS